MDTMHDVSVNDLLVEQVRAYLQECNLVAREIHALGLGVIAVADNMQEVDTYFNPQLWGFFRPEIWKGVPMKEAFWILPGAGTTARPRTVQEALPFIHGNLIPLDDHGWFPEPQLIYRP